MNIKVLIYTTARTNWFAPDFDAIRSYVSQAKGISLSAIDVQKITLPEHVPQTVDPDGDRKPSWAWFEETFTEPARARGYNAVCWHLTKAEQRQLKLTGYNGVYHDDPDDVMEFMIVCNEGQKARHYPYSEFVRLFLHEQGHGVERWLYGRGSNLVHEYDYERRAVHEVFGRFDATRWNVRKAIVTAASQAVPLLEELVAQKTQPTLCQAAAAAEGADASPADLAPDELGCAETVSTIVRGVLPDFPVITGTWTLWDALEHDKRFQRIALAMPECGDIIISPTVPGKPFPGHTGIFAADGKIRSNDSESGTFEKNYTPDSWYRRYATMGRYPIYIYRLTT
ncbi:MAG: hypothetical protein RLO51_11200 [Thalassobaculum sp.]|uniref:hypothetical protein n=1 Tax=Thalassobaculum sp. TaxID=2022740 RepID=UPI0032F07AB1